MLDASRVHPETYEWARKMAIDALEYDDTAEDANPAAALEVCVNTYIELLQPGYIYINRVIITFVDVDS